MHADKIKTLFILNVLAQRRLKTLQVFCSLNEEIFWTESITDQSVSLDKFKIINMANWMSFNRSDGSVQVGTMCDMVKHSFALSDWETSAAISFKLKIKEIDSAKVYLLI